VGGGSVELGIKPLSFAETLFQLQEYLGFSAIVSCEGELILLCVTELPVVFYR
jgi:hypothetical protein